jgi:hypothetical protein
MISPRIPGGRSTRREGGLVVKDHRFTLIMLGQSILGVYREQIEVLEQ